MSRTPPDAPTPTEAPVLRAENLTKIYPLYERRSDRLKEWLSRGRTLRHRDFYALRNVSLEVRPGEIVGIVGRNGSGKSTLLKLLTGITAPTSGRVTARGRISALVDLGAGFNPEYNGLENIYLNGTILGYSRPQIEARLDEILSFADIGDYIRQPVRTYSSGMLVRLAFAVAITVDPDILVVDEALSVGDALFQRKCFERLSRFRREGKTILFVSHSLDTVAQLCGRALLLDAGEILLDASPKLVRNFYYKLLHAAETDRERTRGEIAALNRDREALGRLAVEEAPPEACGSGVPIEKSGPERDFYLPEWTAPSRIEDRKHPVDIEEIGLLNGAGRPVNHLSTHEDYTLSFRMRFGLPVRGLRLNFTIRTVSGFTAAAAHEPARPDGSADDRIETGESLSVTWRFHCSLLAGTYFATVAALGVPEGGSERQDLIRIVDAVVFKVLDDSQGRNGGLVHLGQRVEVRRT